MITDKFAQEFSREWVSSWNSHDIERILSHYTEDFEIESPLALKRFPESKGVLVGKEAIRKYWQMGLSQNPKLRFEILDTLQGVKSLTIYYESKSTQKRVTEVMVFNEKGKVKRAIVNYSK